MSNTKCCVPGCENSKGSHVTLHKFPNPVKEPTLFTSWVTAVGGHILELENDHIFKYRRVCHLHFEEKYWCRNNRISNIALPTLNMPVIISSAEESTVAERSVKTSDTSNELLMDMSLRSNIENAVDKNIDPTTTQLNPEQLLLQINAQDIQMTDCCGPLSLPEDTADKISLMITESSMARSTSKAGASSRRKEPSKRAAHKQKRVAATTAEHNLYKKLVTLGVKLSKYRSKNRKQAVKLKALRNITTNPHFLKTMDNLPSTAKVLTMMQFRECKKKNKGRRFTIEEKIVALSIFKQSPKEYRFLRKIFILPSPQRLLKLLHQTDIKPGINEQIIKQIKKATEKMKTEERLCIVIFDEMSLKANVTYNERKDKVIGFVNNGHKTQPEFADHAQVFMVRGLLKNYKQPVSYTFSQASTRGQELANQLKIVISQLQAAGLIVVATVCDQGTNNVQCYKILVQETRAALLRKGEEPRCNLFTVNGQEIIPLYDPPHLIKCIRNNLLTKDLQYKKNNQNKTAKWQHIQNLHNENPGYQGIRLVPKLTDSHVIPSKISKMKVKYATQVFSQTVASNMGYLADKGILPSECRDTADILLFFDKVFDSVNGSFKKKQKHGKPLLGPATPNSIHHQIWRESNKQLKEMKFVNATTGQIEHVPTLNNWVWTLEGIEVLLKRIQEKYGVTSVWLRHLNQDPIENFFGAIRSHGCRNVSPTPERFESAFTTLLVNSLSNVHAPGANCEQDHCSILNELIITDESKAPPTCEIDHIPDVLFKSLQEKKDPREIGGLQYVSGYFIKKTKTNICKCCTQCKNDLISRDELEYIRYREYAGKQWLCNPSESLLLCVSNLQDINYTLIKTNLEKNNLKELIKTLVFTLIEFNFIKCEKHKDEIVNYLINLSCRFFIHNYCKELNRILNNKRECDDDDDKYKTKAKKYFYKCYKRKNK